MSRTTNTPPRDRTRGLRVRLVALVRAPGPPARPGRRRAARRAVAWGALATLALTLGMAAALDAALPQVREPEYGYRLARVRAQQRARPDRSLLLVLGTSRTQNAVAPDAMGFADEPGSPLAFNFGQSGARPVHLRLTLQRLRADGVRPAAVLVELFPGTLVVPGPADDLFADCAGRLTTADLRRLEPYLDDPAALRRRWAEARLASWHTQRQVIVSHLAPQWQPWPKRLDFQWTMTDEWGFCPYPANNVEERRAERQGRAREEYQSALRSLRVSALSERAYRDLVADCRAAGVPVAFFVTPESPTFRGWYTPDSREALAAFRRVLSEELGVPVFDAPGDFAEGDFADGHHMLPHAAERFSRRLADDLKPWLASGR